MSTRACYTFADKHQCHHVYKHHDGYPSGAEQHISKALSHAWQLPRFEADEFAAAFVAANKDSSGGVRLMPSGDIQDIAASDIEFRYLIEMRGDKVLQVTAFSTRYWEKRDETKLWAGPLSEMKAWATQYEAVDHD